MLIGSNQLRQGHIIIAACGDDCSKSLSPKVKEWFAGMGSKLIGDVGFRQGFVFLGAVGGGPCLEKVAASKGQGVSIT